MKLALGGVVKCHSKIAPWWDFGYYDNRHTGQAVPPSHRVDGGIGAGWGAKASHHGGMAALAVAQLGRAGHAMRLALGHWPARLSIAPRFEGLL